MKPDIDPNDPRVIALANLMNEKAAAVLNADRRIEEAVFPIYSLTKRRLEQTASSVALRIKSEYFLLSASHVFDSIGDYRVSVGSFNGSKIAQLGGDRFSSARGASGTHDDDPIDASVFHIQTEIPETIKKAALTLDDLWVHEKEERANSMFGSVGFRCNQTKVVGTSSTVKYELFPSLEFDEKEYLALKLDRTYHLALAHDDQVLVNDKWQTSPQPSGFSGGAIIYFEGVPIAPAAPTETNISPRLAAITIEQRRRTKTTPGAMVGTRVGFHIALIHQFLPQLFDPSDQ